MCCGRNKKGSKPKSPSELSSDVRKKNKINGFSTSKKTLSNGKRS